jgi:hypothetical protein
MALRIRRGLINEPGSDDRVGPQRNTAGKENDEAEEGERIHGIKG